MNRITLLDGARFISAHIGAQVYFDSRHRLIKTTLDKGIKGELMQERQADGSYKDQYLIIEDSIVEAAGRSDKNGTPLLRDLTAKRGLCSAN